MDHSQKKSRKADGHTRESAHDAVEKKQKLWGEETRFFVLLMLARFN
jgi:hypothetical protein